MKIHQLKPSTGSKKKRKRVGRGGGSGHGNFSGRGIKGQTARTGGKRRPGFEGGQTPLYRRMPKLGGFKNINRIEYAVVNVGILEKHFKENEVVTPQSLFKKGLLSSLKKPVKILGEGELKIALSIRVHKVSKTATEKIEKMKGEIKKIYTPS